MGVQIQIAQSTEDEKELNDFLLERGNLVSLPRIFSAEKASPCPLGECAEIQQVLFLSRDRQLVQDHIRPVSGKTGYFHLTPYLGLAIEWKRTRTFGEVGRVPGRFYYKAGDSTSEASVQALRKLFGQLRVRVKRTYPRRSEGRFPIYVGPHLVRELERKQAEIVYPSGKSVDLVEV